MQCPAGGSNWLEVANICEVIQSLDELEQRLNVVSENSSINSTTTEIKSLMCNKVSKRDMAYLLTWVLFYKSLSILFQLQDIITESFIVSLAPDCSDEKLEVVCARAPICRDAMEARHTLQANPSTDQTSQWINDHIEEEGSVKTFICRSNQLPC